MTVKIETSKIELHGDISIPFLKKSRFTGSFKGMRYVLVKHENELEPATEETQAKTETVIRAIIWPEPFNFLKTPEEKKQRAMFSFDEDGVVDAVGWMNDRLFENKKLWDEAPSRWDTYQM